MLDTVKLASPAISEEVATQIENQLIYRTAYDNSMEHCLYEFSSASIPGSYSSKMHLQVKRKRWVSETGYQSCTTHTFQQECEPFLEVEGSVHKAMMGHNVHGGPRNVQKAIKWLVGDMARRLGVVLPCWASWEVLRVDVAEVYDLSMNAACKQYIDGLRQARYPRRKPRCYGSETVAFPGTTTTWKIYHKGPEFKKNGCALLAKSTDKGYAQKVQHLADGVLRVETSIKSKKLKDMHSGTSPKASELQYSDLMEVHDVETGKVLQEAEGQMETVRTGTKVADRLHSMYKPQLATILYALWVTLSTEGEEVARDRLSKPTFYRQKKQLKDAGVAWDNTDVIKLKPEEMLVPPDFSPVRSDPRRIKDEHPLVKEAYLQVG